MITPIDEEFYTKGTIRIKNPTECVGWVITAPSAFSLTELLECVQEALQYEESKI